MTMDLRPIFLVNGIFLSILSIVMLIPCMVDFAYDNLLDARAFLQSSALTGFVGISLFLANRAQPSNLSVQQAFLLTASCWMILPAFAALPIYFSQYQISYVDAFFEATSGITTTGSTVLTGLDGAPPGLLLWRSLLQWLGGIGIIVLAVAILPILRIGGMQLFRTESSDRSDKIMPRATQVASAIGYVYVVGTCVIALLLWLAGMDGFDAINHAMTSLSTAGFSTHDASIGYYDSVAIEAILILAMLCGGVPFVLLYQFFTGRSGALFRDSQVRWFIKLTCLAVSILTLWLIVQNIYEPAEALRHSLFTTIAIITTTGYTSQDYMLWGAFPATFIFLFCVLGGCTGSTTGGVKIFRLQVLVEIAKVQFNHLISPNAVLRPHYNNRPIDQQVSIAVMSYSILFAVCFLVIAALLSFFGLDFITSMSGAAIALANIGPGLGDVIGPTGNFSSLPDGAKLVLSFGMILGRLELFTILILFTPIFWRD